MKKIIAGLAILLLTAGLVWSISSLTSSRAGTLTTEDKLPFGVYQLLTSYYEEQQPKVGPHLEYIKPLNVAAVVRDQDGKLFGCLFEKKPPDNFVVFHKQGQLQVAAVTLDSH